MTTPGLMASPGVMMYARHGRFLYGESPERGLVTHLPLANSKGVRREAESGGSSRQILDLRNTNRI